MNRKQRRASKKGNRQTVVDPAVRARIRRKFDEAVRLYQLRRYDAAENIFGHILEHHPEQAVVWRYMALIALERHDYVRAERHVKRAVRLAPVAVEGYMILCRFLRERGRYEEAQETAKKTIAMCPDKAETHLMLASIHRDQGNEKAAVTSLNKAISLSPNLIEAHYMRARTKTFLSPDELEFRALEKLEKNKVGSDRERALVLASLAKVNEDVGRPEKGFEYAGRAAGLIRKNMDYNVQSDLDYMRRLADFFSQDALRNYALQEQGRIGRQKKCPIFIVGLPRSGTTLVEQILSSHPDVYGAGELESLRMSLLSAFSADALKTLGPDLADAMSRANFKVARRSYLDDLERLGARERFVADKTPANFQWLGLIRILFPDAKIINCLRNPADMALSIYCNMTTKNVPWYFDLKEMGQYYRGYRELMRHWQQVMGRQLMTIRYEDLVNNQEKMTRDLLAHCGLEWADSCLTFWEHKRGVRTASVLQVRKPVYKMSIQRWHRVKKQMLPFVDSIGPYAKEC